MSTQIRSFSKINLGLVVGPLRPDGFHGLASVYQTLNLHDLLTVSAHRLPAGEAIQIHLVCERDGHPDPAVPQTATGNAEKNTAYRMILGALQRLNISARVDILIQKSLPVQGGMGAGSANAAAALQAIEAELNERLMASDRLALAAEIGSDVPLFLVGGTTLGLGRGEIVSELPDLPETPCCVALPSVGVSTRLAFTALDARTLTFQQAERRLAESGYALAAAFGSSVPSGIAGPQLQAHQGDLAGNLQGSQRAGSLGWENPLLALVRTGIENDFEEVAFSQHPFLRDIKRELVGEGHPGAAVYAALSGSGSALFGLYQSPADAEAARLRVEASGVRAVVTRTMSRKGMLRALDSA